MHLKFGGGVRPDQAKSSKIKEFSDPTFWKNTSLFYRNSIQTSNDWFSALPEWILVIFGAFWSSRILFSIFGLFSTNLMWILKSDVDLWKSDETSIKWFSTLSKSILLIFDAFWNSQIIFSIVVYLYTNLMWIFENLMCIFVFNQSNSIEITHSVLSICHTIFVLREEFDHPLKSAELIFDHWLRLAIIMLADDRDPLFTTTWFVSKIIKIGPGSAENQFIEYFQKYISYFQKSTSDFQKST